MAYSLRRSVLGGLAALMFGSMLSFAQADSFNNLPSLGDAGEADLSVQEEKRLGALIMKDYRTFGAVNSDPEITAYLNRLGSRIVQAAGEQPSNFEFFLVTDRALNAFAMPGGYIGVHTGLIATARTEDELASVLSHEVGHVVQRHIARSFAKQKQASMVATAAAIAALLAAGGGNAQAAMGAMAAGAGYSADQQLSFSRDAEREADRVGLQTLKQAGFDPQGMIDFFGRLQTASRLYENNAPVYLRTHPLTSARIADIRSRVGLGAQSKGGQQQAAPLVFELIRMRALVFGDTTKQQLTDRLKSLAAPNAQEGFTNPIALAYGRSLLLANLERTSEALKAVQSAIDQFSQSSAGEKGKAPVPQLLQSQRLQMALDMGFPASALAVERVKPKTQAELNDQEKAMLADLTAYLTQFKSDLTARLLYADGLQRLGLFQQADSDLKEWAQVYRSNPRIFDLLAQSELALGREAESHLYLAQAYNARSAYLPAIEQADIAKRLAKGNYYLLAEIDDKQREYKRKADEERQYLRTQGH
jgi:predicted Zn-dependent protease